MQVSAGKRFRSAIEQHRPLQVVGTINAYCALMAEQVGHQAIYLSGAGVANASFGLPDLGMTSLDNVLEDANRICSVTDLPLLVDIDTGWGGAFNISNTVKQMIRAGVAAVHIEDQVAQKRCGHRPNKELVSCGEMVDRIKAAADGRFDNDFFIMARTDAYAQEGLDGAIARARAYVEAGADGIFAEAVNSLEDYRAFKTALNVPILANITEFGKTPLFTLEQLGQVGVNMVLYPLSAFRAMNQAALSVYETLKDNGSQQSLISNMQTREQLYQFLNYYQYESKLDELFSQSK